jgi:rhodanese-related sulfurtransferase
MTDQKSRNPIASRFVLLVGALLIASVIYISYVAQLGPGSDTAPSAGVDPELLVAFRLDTDTLTLIDARSPEEHAAAHIPGAINVPFDAVEANASLLPADKERLVVVHCKTGRRAGLLKEQLDAMGYADVRILPSEQIEWGPDGPIGLNPGGN